MAERKQRGLAGDKTICLPIADDIDYATLSDDRESYRVGAQTFLMMGLSPKRCSSNNQTSTVASGNCRATSAFRLGKFF